MIRRPLTCRRVDLHDEESFAEEREMAPAQRLDLVWELTVNAWAFAGADIRESRLRRDVVRLVRGGG